MRISSQNVAAKAVNGGDIRAAYIGCRIVEMQLFCFVRFLVRQAVQLRFNALLHFGSGGTGKGHDKKLIDLDSRGDEPCNAFGHNGGLACAGGSRYEKISLCFDRSFLFLCENRHEALRILIYTGIV